MKKKHTRKSSISRNFVVPTYFVNIATAHRFGNISLTKAMYGVTSLEGKNGYIYQSMYLRQIHFSALRPYEVADIMRQIGKGAKLNLADVHHFSDAYPGHFKQILDQDGLYFDTEKLPAYAFAAHAQHSIGNEQIATMLISYLFSKGLSMTYFLEKVSLPLSELSEAPDLDVPEFEGMVRAEWNTWEKTRLNKLLAKKVEEPKVMKI